MNYRSTRLRALIRFASCLALAIGMTGCGGPSFEASTLTDASAETSAVDAGPDIYLPPIIVRMPGDDQDATVDANADATVTDSGADVTLGADSSPDTGATVDAGCVSLSDVHSCGSCSHDCTQLLHVSAAGVACLAGVCSYACAPGYADCVDAGTGCGTLLSSAANCGACGTSCGGATPLCAPADAGSFACASHCATGQTICGSSCSNLTTDPVHCGGCDVACPAAQVCTAGMCRCPTSANPDLCGAACTSLQADNEQRHVS